MPNTTFATEFAEAIASGELFEALTSTSFDQFSAIQDALSDQTYILDLVPEPSLIERGTSSDVTFTWRILGKALTQTFVDLEAGPIDLPDGVAARRCTLPGVNSTRRFVLTAEFQSRSNLELYTYDMKYQVGINVVPRRFWGVADSATLTGAQVVELSNSDLWLNKEKAFSIDAGGGAGKYIYMAYAAEYGDPAIYKLANVSAAPVKTTVSVTTAAGVTGDYRVLRSPTKLTGVVPVLVE